MRKFVFIFLVLGSQFLFSKVIFESTSEGMKYKVELFAEGFGVIWAMDFIDKETIIFTQKNGKISLLNTKSKKVTSLSVSPKGLMVGGQGGLLDVEVPQDKTGWIYFTYVKGINSKGVTTLTKAKLKGNALVSWQDLHVSKSATDTQRHFGSRIAFDEDGHIFYSIGDRGFRPNGQDKNTHAGSILRLHVDGDIPKDNPFVGKDGLDEIYSYGHRNPQGLFYDKNRKKLFSIEHGPRGGDEINIIEKGANYGWATISHGKEYWGSVAVGEGTHKIGMNDALHVYIPSIAPSSIIVYSGKAFPKWKGDLFSGALKLTHLNRIVLNENDKVIKEERLLEKLRVRIRDIKESYDGNLYLSTDNGLILKISPQ